MSDEELVQLAEEEGFLASIIYTRDVPLRPEFRIFCEDNLCGNYNARYSCPPGCGTPQEVRDRLLAEDKALVLETIHEIRSYDDEAAVLSAQKELNLAIINLMQKLRKAGVQGFCLGYGGCPLCNPCKQVEDTPCAFPDKRISCMSAYCIDVAELAERSGLEFAWSDTKLFLFGMIAFRDGK